MQGREKVAYQHWAHWAPQKTFVWQQKSLVRMILLTLRGKSFSGPKKTMTATDGTGFCAFFSARNRAIFSTFGGNFLSNLHVKGQNPLEKIQKIQWRNVPEVAVFCHLSWSNRSWHIDQGGRTKSEKMLSTRYWYEEWSCQQMGQIANRQSLVFSERSQLSQAIPQVHVERILHQRTPIARFESQRSERRAMRTNFCGLGGDMAAHERWWFESRR